MLLPADLSWLGYSFYWWEHAFLLLLGIWGIGLLFYSRRYLCAILGSIDKTIYISIIILIGLQYIGEHGHILLHDFGVDVEEGSESIIYLIGFFYLWRFKIGYFEDRLTSTQLTKTNHG